MEEPIGFSRFKAFVNTANDYPSMPSVVTLNNAVEIIEETIKSLDSMKRLIENGPEGAKTDAYYLLQNYIWPVLGKFKEWK